MIREPRLLDGSLDEVRRIHPVSFSVTENSTPLSTASIQLQNGDSVPERAWVEMYTPNGSAGVFRVRTPQKAYGDQVSSVELEHGITEVGDYLVEAEIKEDMALNSAIQMIFGHYTSSAGDNAHWQLGANTFTDTVGVDIEYESVLEAILMLLDQTNYMLSFDFTTSPWTVSVVQADQNVTAEGRLGRNVLSAQVQKDDSELATRVFAAYETESDGEMTLTWIYEQDNDAIEEYGIVEAKISETSDDETAARAAATRYLNKHKKTKISVSINGYDFSSVTGESLDQIRVGKKYRLAIEGESDPVEEVIRTITWQSLEEDEFSAMIRLAEEDDVLIKTMNKTKSIERSSRRAGRKADMLAYDFYSEDGTLHSSLLMTASILRTEFDAANSTMYSVIEQTATYISTEVASVRSDVHSFILQTPEMIHSEVGSMASGFAHSIIEQTATYIRSEVSNAASSISASVIEQTASYIRSEVASVASGIAWSVVEQTMTGIIQEVGRKSTIYVQWADPNDGVNVLYNGDIWIEAATVRTWNDLGRIKWSDVAAYKWRNLYGANQYVWKNGAWLKVGDQAAMVESQVKIEQDDEHWAALARAVDLQGQEYRSNLTVTAQKISSDVSTAKSQLYSSIEQTATQISMKVVDVQNGLSSQIVQTASQIRSEVTSAASGLQSSITQNADKISLVVTQKNGQNVVNAASIVLGINNQDKTSSSYVDISADKINLTGYVTATQLNAQKARIDELINGSLLAGTIKSNHLKAGSSLTLDGKYHHNSTITIGGINYQIVTWGTS